MKNFGEIKLDEIANSHINRHKYIFSHIDEYPICAQYFIRRQYRREPDKCYMLITNYGNGYIHRGVCGAGCKFASLDRCGLAINMKLSDNIIKSIRHIQNVEMDYLYYFFKYIVYEYISSCIISGRELRYISLYLDDIDYEDYYRFKDGIEAIKHCKRIVNIKNADAKKIRSLKKCSIMYKREGKANRKYYDDAEKKYLRLICHYELQLEKLRLQNGGLGKMLGLAINKYKSLEYELKSIKNERITREIQINSTIENVIYKLNNMNELLKLPNVEPKVKDERGGKCILFILIGLIIFILLI